MIGAVQLALLAFVSSAAAQDPLGIQPTAFTAPGVFPTSAFSSYYNNPTATSEQPQPIITDAVTYTTYPYSLTDPYVINGNNTEDPHPLPFPATPELLYTQALSQIQSIATNPAFGNSSCGRCQASLEVSKFLALAAPEQVPNLLVALCEYFNYSTTCAQTYGLNDYGGIITQVLAYADVGGYDGQAICEQYFSLCALPPTTPLDLTSWFAKPKPNPLPPPKTPSGQRLKVLHVSDAHLDPRFDTGAEANCSDYLCCRSNAYNSASPNVTLFPAPRYGAFQCDTPYSLMLAAMESIQVLANTAESPFAWTVFTGDLVSHDPDYQISRDYVMYFEAAMYGLFQQYFGPGPVYAVLGNHDSAPQAQDAQHFLGGDLASQFSWNYDHVSSLWQYEGWINDSTVELARTDYAAYMVNRMDGLRIITLNTDFWYRSNYFNYINLSHPDPSGMLRFLTDELQAAEDAGDRVWIVGHVLSGWDGTQALLNPTDLFYQIVDRFSPHVIANIFFGHTHEDELSIFYSNNGTNPSVETAQVVSWIAPSITPLTNLNSGFRVYEVDSATFDILDAHTWKSDVNSFSALDGQIQYGPTYEYEYNTRQAYGANVTWGVDDPLNATWWHMVSQVMETDPTLVETFNMYQGKSSVRTQPCTGACATAKVCYMRSGSASISTQYCNQNYGSVQG
ncbi:hypothetical protein JAAARDRAFT_150983 [Jaapia argillacea MUCL 33604]|uniref:Sphingomyelin phosphodiesterase n=1 Tax=Jaapia argillacea MUCL 33604 TaxID=933084 RepID=A0A067QHE6_9AGAM|nr:hypothetical protein JAAARDRAFT_150983 [Jaapia argillacea MUCL 33604]